MAKKKRKRRYRKKLPKQLPVTSSACDLHHIFWIRRKWTHGWAHKLRDFWYCKVEIPKDTVHRRIHLTVQHIPVPTEPIAKSAVLALYTLDSLGKLLPTDSLTTRLNLLINLFPDCPTRSALKQQLSAINPPP